MNDSKKMAWLYVALTAVISGVAVWFQYILNRDYVDSEVGLYKLGVLTPEAFYIFISIAGLFAVSSVFMLRKDALPKDLKHGGIITGFTAAGSAILVVFSSVVYFMERKNSFSLLESQSVNKLRLACSIIGFLAALYYLNVAFSGKTKSKAAPFLSFFPVIWTLIYLMSIYFDHSVLINSPIRIIRQLALIVFMLYQLFESRAMLGKTKAYIYFILSTTAVMFLSAAFIPDLIVAFKGGIDFSLETAYSAYCGFSALYVFARSMDFAACCDGDSGYVKKLLAPMLKNEEELFTEEESD